MFSSLQLRSIQSGWQQEKQLLHHEAQLAATNSHIALVTQQCEATELNALADEERAVLIEALQRQVTDNLMLKARMQELHLQHLQQLNAAAQAPVAPTPPPAVIVSPPIAEPASAATALELASLRQQALAATQTVQLLSSALSKIQGEKEKLEKECTTLRRKLEVHERRQRDASTAAVAAAAASSGIFVHPLSPFGANSPTPSSARSITSSLPSPAQQSYASVTAANTSADASTTLFHGASVSASVAAAAAAAASPAAEPVSPSLRSPSAASNSAEIAAVAPEGSVSVAPFTDAVAMLDISPAEPTSGAAAASVAVVPHLSLPADDAAQSAAAVWQETPLAALASPEGDIQFPFFHASMSQPTSPIVHEHEVAAAAATLPSVTSIAAVAAATAAAGEPTPSVVENEHRASISSSMLSPGRAASSPSPSLNALGLQNSSSNGAPDSAPPGED